MAIPLLVGSMVMTARGWAGARFVWLGAVAYLAYNSVLITFAAHFNSLFLLFVAMLSLAVWSLVSLLRDLDIKRLHVLAHRVPVRLVAVYMLACAVLFAFVWLRDIGPAMLHNTMPASFGNTGMLVAPTHVLDFGFTFPLLVVGAVWIWRCRPWGYVIAGALVIMLTVETLSIALDQTFGHYHDPTQPLGAVPIMIALTVIGMAMSLLFLRKLSVGRDRT